MACNIQRNQSGDIISATTNTGEESVLFNQLDNLSDSKEVAATLYAVTETAESLEIEAMNAELIELITPLVEETEPFR